MDFEKLLNLLDKAIEKSAKKLNTKLLELLENGGDLNTAFASFNDEFWADFLKAYNKANNQQLSLDELMNLRADKITLSKALYTELREVKNSVKSVIKTAIKEQKSANELAKMLFEGYDFKADPLKVKRKFPKYLWEKSAKTKVKNIKTPALRAAYSKLLKDESKLVANKALKVAGYEKARYYAKRIALNETARAYNDARAFEYANSNDIQVVKIQMSITHPRTDICDYYAGVDKYGLGAGVYPKDKAPVPPYHPFCRCQMVPKYAHEYSKPKLNANADKEYLSGLKEWQRARILGSKAKADAALKTGDINSVFNAMKPERYKVKSINEVAKYQKNKKYSQSEIDSIIDELTLKQGAQMPKNISLDELKTMGIFDNISNAEDHLKTRQDSKNRLNNLGLILPTIEKYDLKIKVRQEGEMRYKYIKKYSNGKVSLVSLSIDNKILYTIIPSIREQQLRKELKKAEK